VADRILRVRARCMDFFQLRVDPIVSTCSRCAGVKFVRYAMSALWPHDFHLASVTWESKFYVRHLLNFDPGALED
jgi:hypothetical protein